MNTTQQIIKNNLIYFLKEQQKTQTELAQATGVSEAAVSKWIRGTAVPQMDKLDMICRFFDISITELMTDNTQPDIQVSPGTVRMITMYQSLNALGRKEALKYLELLTGSERYHD